MKKKLGYYLGLALLRGLAYLPYGLVARLGHGLGSLAYRLPSARKRVVRTNLLLCFPQMDVEARERLTKAHFQQVIRGFAERGVQWFGSARTLLRLTQFESAIDLSASDAPPTIFLGFHFVAIEAGCMVYSINYPVASLYTPMSDGALDGLALRQRARFGTDMIPRSDSARQALRTLRDGKPLMLAADMDFGLRDSVFVPFFGVAACTLTSVSRLAKASGARVVPFVTEVLPAYRGYKLTIFEQLADFPSDDVTVDAGRMNHFLEQQIQRIPDQYYWVHKRFKHRPAGEPSVY